MIQDHHIAHVSGTTLEARVARVRQGMAEAGLGMLLILQRANIFYLTGFGGTAAALVLTPDRLVFITDGRYSTDAEALLTGTGLTGVALVSVTSSYDESIVEVLADGPDGVVGFEDDVLTVKRHAWLTAALAARSPGSDVTLVAGPQIVERARVCKDAHEVAVFRAAGRLLSTVAVDVMPRVRAGRSEREIAADVDWALRVAGFERPAFETIVASGPNSAKPHARPGQRLLERGDLVVLDFGGVYDGYCVDLTRTLSVGAPGADAVCWHGAVLAAQAAALSTVGVGVPASRVDEVARSALEASGMAEAFSHGTGHGLGIDIHEAPRVGRPRSGVAEPPAVGATLDVGMVFTIEPGVYFPGRGGVRVEDDVLVTEAGYEALTDVPKALQIV